MAERMQTRVGTGNGRAVGGCSVHELFGLLLGSAARSQRERVRELLSERSLAELARWEVPELVSRGRLSGPSARRVAAAFELVRRARREPSARPPVVATPRRVHELLGPELLGRRREVVLAVLLDGKHRLRRWLRISEGTLTSSLVHPREVFGPAVREGAAAVICAHNHPSGDPEPSGEDLAVTRRLVAAGRLLGVPLLDHVVIAGALYCSIRDRLGPEWDRIGRG